MKTRDQLLAEAKPYITDEGYAELTFWPEEELEAEVEAIKSFVPDSTLGY